MIIPFMPREAVAGVGEPCRRAEERCAHRELLGWRLGKEHARAEESKVQNGVAELADGDAIGNVLRRREGRYRHKQNSDITRQKRWEDVELPIEDPSELDGCGQ